MRAIAAMAAAALLLGGAALAGKPHPKAKPTPYVDDKAGFALAIPAGWRVVGQDTAQGEQEPLLKVTNDDADQWLVVVRHRGPTDDVTSDEKAALARFEGGFQNATGYKKLSLKTRKLPRHKGGKASIPAFDLWFVMERDGKPVVIGARTLFFRSYTLTLVVDGPGKKPGADGKKLVASFVPALDDE